MVVNSVLDKYTLLSLVRWDSYQKYIKSDKCSSLETRQYTEAKDVLEEVMRSGDYKTTAEDLDKLDALFSNVYTWIYRR